jgi:hypothetical protein
MLTKWERKILLDKLHNLEVNPDHVKAVKYRVKKKLIEVFRDLQLVYAVFPDLQNVIGVAGIRVVRGVGFEPTNPYGTGASVQVHDADLAHTGLERPPSPESSSYSVTALDRVIVFGNYLDWEKFQEYVKNNYSRIHASAILSYARRYGYLLEHGDLSPLLTLSRDKRRHVMAALAALARFAGKYDEWAKLKQKYGLKIEQNLKIAFQIDDSSLRELLEWIAKARAALGEYAPYLDLLLATGVRPSEGILIFNLIINLHSKGRLDMYYRDGWLEHFRFESLFCRRSKNVYVSYAPEQVVKAVTGVTHEVSMKKIRRLLEANGLEIKLKQIRKLWASYMTKFLTESEINLLQGRVGKSVFMSHYFNPSYTVDLKKRLEKGIKSLFLLVVTGVTGEKKDLAAGGEPSR